MRYSTQINNCHITFDIKRWRRRQRRRHINFIDIRSPTLNRSGNDNESEIKKNDVHGKGQVRHLCFKSFVDHFTHLQCSTANHFFFFFLFKLLLFVHLSTNQHDIKQMNNGKKDRK